MPKYAICTIDGIKIMMREFEPDVVESVLLYFVSMLCNVTYEFAPYDGNDLPHFTHNDPRVRSDNDPRSKLCKYIGDRHTHEWVSLDSEIVRVSERCTIGTNYAIIDGVRVDGTVYRDVSACYDKNHLIQCLVTNESVVVVKHYDLLAPSPLKKTVSVLTDNQPLYAVCDGEMLGYVTRDGSLYTKHIERGVEISYPSCHHGKVHEIGCYKSKLTVIFRLKNDTLETYQWIDCNPKLTDTRVLSIDCLHHMTYPQD